MPADAQRVRDLFLAAAELPADQRASFLATHCGDAELGAAVERLLAAHEQPASVLDRPAPGMLTAEYTPITERLGSCIGPYKLLQQIGEGGMGVVYMAEQEQPVRRKVALKIIKPGMDSRQILARFEAERQALALMDHPNIARVLDAGTSSAGRPYFVMEIVKGVPITRYCDEHRLTPRQRLELFIPVCQAVQHAHQKGIIHRDLKPSNVLVALYDGKPVPKVIDFGVAKAARQSLTDKTLVTGFGAIVGTLEYMSPEQAEINQLDIDTRSDIYSLGVLLYELLTGSPPFTRKDLEKAGMLEMLRVIREQEPSKPSTKLSTADGLPTLAANRGTDPAKLTRLVRGELDWIVMKALEKDRGRRYEAANGLAADIQRYLADEPVQACPPSATYRLRKLIRRNKGLVLAASLFLLALVGGVIGTSVGLIQAKSAEGKARGEAEQKDVARKQAEANLTLVLAALDEVYITEAEKRLFGVTDFGLAKREGEAQLTQSPSRSELTKRDQQTAVERDFLKKGLGFYEKLIQPNSTEPFAQFQTAKAYLRVGIMQAQLGRRDEAKGSLKKATSLLEKLVEEASTHAEYRSELVEAYRWQVQEWASEARGLPGSEAERVCRRGVALADQLVAESPANPVYRRRAADYRVSLGFILRAMARTEEAEEVFRRALARYQELAAEFPTENWYRREIAFTLDCLGWLMQQTVKRPDRAEPFFRQALPYHARLAVEDPALAADERERLARDFRHLGDVLLEQGKHAEAAETAVEWARLLPNALETYRDAIFLLDRCASLVKEDAKLSDAERQVAASRYAERSEELTREAKKRGAGGDARFWRNRGDVYVNLRQWEKAAAAYTEVLALAPENAWLLHGLGMVQYRAGHFAPAIQALKHSLTLNGANAKDFLLLAMSHWQRGEKEQARQWYNAALLRKEYELRRWRWSAGEPTALLREADALMGTGRAAADPTTLDKPESYTRIIEAQPEAAWAYQLRGQLHRRLGNTQQADRDTRRAYDLLRRNLPTGPEALNGMGRAGSHYLESNNWDMAVIAFSKAIELKADEPWYYNERGMAYLVLEKYAEAATDYAKEIELNPNHAPLYARRGYAYLRCGERDKALADIAKALELNPEHERGWDSWSWDMAMMLCAELDQWKTLAARVAHWKAVETNGSNMSSLRYLHALASLAADDFAAYRSVCASMLEQFGRTDDAASAHWVAWTCALAPDAVTDWNQPVKLARFALQQKGTESDRHARTTALGALLCRAGRFADAIEALQEANGVWEKAAVKPPMSSPVYTWFFLAMAHHRLGHAEEARNWLDKANQFIEKQAKDPVNEPSQPWNRRMTHRLLRREAETLIHGADKKQREPAK